MKTLKNAPTCFDLIQIIFRELICFLLKLLILEFVTNVKVNVVMRQHNIWCVYVLSVWWCVPDCISWCVKFRVLKCTVKQWNLTG